MTTEVRPADWYREACRRAVAAGRRRAAAQASADWPEFAPPVALSDGPLGAVQAADREIGRLMAARARAVAEFAATRPAEVDRAQGEPGAMSAERWAARPEICRPVSEWAAREFVVGLSITAQAADQLLVHSLTLVHRLPGTLAALEAGALHPGHLWTMLDKVAPIEDARIRAEVEAELLRWAAGRVVTPTQLNDKARREVLRRDVRAAARQLNEALKQRGIFLRPGTVDGMATVTVVATLPEAKALYRALAACAESLDDAGVEGEGRTRGQKMVDCLLDLVLRPGETDLPPVQVLLTVVAALGTLAGGDEPGEIDGQVVPAETIRQFLAALTGQGRPTDISAVSGTGSAARQPADQDAPDERLPEGALSEQSMPEGSMPEGSMSWQERDDAELVRWMAERERQILAGELVDPDPEPVPLAPTSGPPQPDLWFHLPEHMLAALDAQLADDVGDELLDSTPPDWLTAKPPAPPPGRTPTQADHAPPQGTGSWAAADQAVDEASRAVFEARQSLFHARRMVGAAAAADSADETAWQAGPEGHLNDAEDALGALWLATDDQRERIAALLETTAGGGLADRPRIALTDALSGTLLALSDLPGLRRAGTCGRAACRRSSCRCTHDLSNRPGLGPPGPTDGYRPSAELDRFMRARDRRCRFPGCRRRVPKGGELDHDVPHPEGPTSAANLAGYCTTDHRGKHQAPGWEHRLDADGTLTVTTPTGLVVVTTPCPY